MIDEVDITALKITPQKPFVEIVQELCKETEPKPLYCELPEDLKLRAVASSGTVQTYTFASSLATTSISGTSTTLLVK